MSVLEQPKVINIDFSDPNSGFNSGVADYTEANEDAVNFKSGISIIPDIEHTKGFKLRGTNVSDDLFMYVSKPITGLVPGQYYVVKITTLQIATNVPAGQVGTGGAPGESVYLKAGAVGALPKTFTKDGRVYTSFDHGIQANRGRHMAVVGNLAKSSGSLSKDYELKTMKTKALVGVKASSKGELWLLFGSDSGFESASAFYFTNATIELTPISFSDFSNVIENNDVDLPIEFGSKTITTSQKFNTLSVVDNIPGGLRPQLVKFLVANADTPEPQIYFMNTNTFENHYPFAQEALNVKLSNGEFNAVTYFRDDGREFIAGVLMYHPNSVHKDVEGIYTFGFWPSDPVKHKHVYACWQLIQQNMPISHNRIFYNPASDIHGSGIEIEQSAYSSSGILIKTNEDLLGEVSYIPLNLGQSFGKIRLIGSNNRIPPTVSDIVVLETVPSDLTHVAGIITEEPQTPLSHINLKAKQNKTPNCFLKDASLDESIRSLEGKPAFLNVGPEKIEVREATQTEVDTYLEASRPKEPQFPPRDLQVKAIRPLTSIGFSASHSIGSKAANIAEMNKFITDVDIPQGFAVPFYFYDQFMKENNLYEKIQELMTKKKFKNDTSFRTETLKQFRSLIKASPLPEELRAQLLTMYRTFPEGTSLRFRSSTNNEDLLNFNGAGLYSSYTHRPDEGHPEKSAKQVWASMWNFRAFEERTFYRIDHFTTAMGVLVHPNYDKEVLNGVVVTKNLFDPSWPDGFYFNIQIGEELVTNPEGKATPEQIAVFKSPTSTEGDGKWKYIITRVRYSNLVKPGVKVLSDEQVDAFIKPLKQIQKHFKQKYNAQDNPNFAMEAEIKIDKDNRLVIKQARPWLD